ncbi:AraC family transcriptional regulator [Paenibacillus sp. CC-CFT747]|nr:AraC family transcriptional regulator [Paenibacillus sp. CC-CFT747]
MKIAELHPYVHYATRFPFAPGQASRSRMCYSSSLYLISEGKGRLTTCGRTYETYPGALVYIPAGQPHDWIAEPEDPMVHVCCYFDWAHHIPLQAQHDHPHIICYDLSKLNPALVGPAFPYSIPEYIQVDKVWQWVERFELFYTPNEFPDDRTYFRHLKVQSQFQDFIGHFLSFVLKDEHIPDPRIVRLLEEMDQDLVHGQVLPLEEYYRKCRLSRGYFFSLFKETTGLSPIQYVNRYRINRAKEELQGSGLSITEIAEKYQFSSIHYFSKLFRQLTGMTPSEYRERT